MAGLFGRRLRATVILAALIALGAASVRTGQRVPPVRAKVSDITTYHRILDRLRAGDGYYDTIGGELRRFGYATREVFNWRTPLLWTAEARVSDGTVKAVLLVVTAVLCAATPLLQVGWLARVLALVMQLGMLALFAGTDIYVMSEPWAGVLIALSICAFHWRRQAGGVALGLLALFVRELAAPYCIVATLIAARERRWREVTAWLTGAAIYFVYYGWHLSHVLSHRLPGDISHGSSWLALGGLASVVTKVHWHGWLILLPMWVTAAALPVIVASLADGRSDGRARATAAAYLLFFLAAGQPFDWYWGLVAWPAWTLAFAGGLRSIAGWSRTAIGWSHDPGAPVVHAAR